MNPATASHVAAPLRVFVTNEDGGKGHSAEDWAIVTARMLISTGQNISPAKLDEARTLRTKLLTALMSAFNAVKATSSQTEIDAIAAQTSSAIRALAQGTPWEMEFGHEQIQAMMLDVVRRNLATHADVQLRTE